MKSTILILAAFCSFVLACTTHSEPDHTSHGMTNDSAMPEMSQMQHGDEDHSSMIVLTESEKYLAGIRTEKVAEVPFRNSISVLGVVSVDDNSRSIITAKVSGRIEKLYARNPGMDISTGTPLFSIYSETVLAGELELLQLIKSNASTQLIESARNKLLLYGVSKTQLVEVERRQLPNAMLDIQSPANGFLETLNIQEGQYVNTGDVLFGIASLNSVRINAQFYPDEVDGLDASATFTIGGDSSKTATVIFTSPTIEKGSKVYNVVLRVDNEDHQLRPGMMIMVQAITYQENLLGIPRSALLEDEGMRFVWIQEPDGMFSRRMVETGKENLEFVQIVRGLKVDEIVVTKGTYLLNSEYVLRNGANSMGGMKM